MTEKGKRQVGLVDEMRRLRGLLGKRRNGETQERKHGLLESTKEVRALSSVAAKSPYLSVEQVAERYGVAVGTVHNWTSQRSIPYRKPTGGRVIFAPADLDLWDAGCELEVRQGKGRAIAVLPRKVAEPSRVAA